MPQKSAFNLITALTNPEAYQHPVNSVSIIETHISWVLLTGDYAYKIKKPVNFGFLDFSTLEKRKFFCNEEIRLNQRFSPDLYLEVVAITGAFDKPQIGGTGDVIDYAVKMLQFPAGQTLSERAELGQLEIGEIDQLSKSVAGFHHVIEKAAETSDYGQSENIKHWFDENFAHINPLLIDTNHLEQLKKIQLWGNLEWDNKAGLMQIRRQQGYVRECHGDLHLSNITLINNQVRLFDCIEFNPMLRWVDVISEIAFLIIDLLHFGYETYAHRFLNHYLQSTGDYQSIALLRYYLVYRALVCAKVALLRDAQQTTKNDSNRICYNNFANLAESYTKVTSPKLMITHGFSGSGKSTLSQKLAENIDAIQIRSDIERKRLFNHQVPKNEPDKVGAGLYSQEISFELYLYLAQCAKTIIQAGFSVIIDASFLKNDQRNLFRELAVDCNVQFIILDVQASDEELNYRIVHRQNDASEATIEVLNHQLCSAEALTTEELTSVITVDTEAANTFEKLIDQLRK